MARIRSIKPEFPQSESMGRVSRDARLCFVNLWTICDDVGRARGSSRMLASLLFPYDDDAPKLISKWLDELERERCVIRYEIDGTHYIQIAKWLDHQKIDHPTPSRLPAPLESSRTFAKDSEALAPDLGPRTMDLGEDQVSIAEPQAASARETPKPKRQAARKQEPEGFVAFYEAYPLHKARPAAAKAYARILEQARASPEQLLDGAKRYAIERNGEEPQFTKHPATWLNNDGWLDEVTQHGHGSHNGKQNDRGRAAMRQGFAEFALAEDGGRDQQVGEPAASAIAYLPGTRVA